MEEGKLLYAIIDLQRGDGPRVPVSPCPRPTGINDAPLETIPYRDLAAVVSSIDLKRFGQACPVETRHVASVQREGEERLQADMLRYQQVNLSLLESHTVVPMRFGFIARDREHVEKVLEKTYLQLRTLLNRLKGKVELVVQAFWDLPKILREIAAHQEDGRRPTADGEQEDDRRPTADGGQRSAVSGQLSVEVGRRLFEAAEARKKELTTVIHVHLFPWAIDSSEGPLKTLNHSLPLAGGGQGRGCIEHIFNRSYLVEREKESLFDAAVDRLGAGYEGYLTFRYIGPLPAYSFANVELSQGNFEVMDQARKTLGLPEKATLEEIKAAYRRLALTSHPDRHPEDPQAEERFKAATHAYEVLEAYCHSLQNFPEGILRTDATCRVSTRQAALYSFAREEVERTFIVKER